MTNLETGQSVIVTINDRGPYVQGRQLDLSQAAAKQIGLTHARPRRRSRSRPKRPSAKKCTKFQRDAGVPHLVKASACYTLILVEIFALSPKAFSGFLAPGEATDGRSPMTMPG